MVALQLVGTMASLYLPSLNADIIDNGIARGDTGYIMATGGWMLAVTLLQVVCSVAAVYFGARTAMGFGRDVRSALFHRVGEFSAREVGRFGAPSLITRNTNDVQQVQMLVLVSCTMLVAAPIMCVGGVVMALQEDVGLSWLMAVSVPVLIVAIGLVIARMVPQFRLDAGAHRRRQPRAARADHRHPRGPRVRARARRDASGSARPTPTSPAIALAAGRLQALIFPIVMLVLNVSSVAVLWFGAGRIDAGQMQIGALTAFLAYLLQILMAVMMATFMAIMIPRAAVCADRIMEVLETRGVGRSRPPRRSRRCARTAGWRSTTSRSATRARPRRCCATCRSPRGPGRRRRSSAAPARARPRCCRLVPRLFDATGGAVRVDGVDVRDLEPDDLWGRIGLVPQRPYLFSGTVASNLRYGNPDATDEELWAALEVAQGARLRAGHARGPRGADRPGRHQRLRRPAAAARDRPRARAHGPRSTCSTTRSRRSTSPPTPGCAPR